MHIKGVRMNGKSVCGMMAPGSCTRSGVPRLTALLLGITALVALPAFQASAQSAWDGSASSDWDTPANWNTNAVPTSSDDVTIDDVTVNAPVVGSGVSANTDSLLIGVAGDGSLQITGTGELTVGGDLGIGWDAGGTLEVTGGGSLISGHGSLGDGAAASGEALVSGAGSSWLATGISVGYEGFGSLTIAGGATVTGEGYIGDNVGSGTVLVTGAGSSWNTGGELLVGANGTGDLTVADGATVESVTAQLGWGSTGSGTALVTGAGSGWTSTNGFYVGTAGDGELVISDGGSLTVTAGDSAIGFFSNGSGEIRVTGAGSTFSNKFFMIGSNGAGAFILENGAVAESGGVLLGGAVSGTGTALVSGAGTSWNVSGLTVGFQGDGMLTLADDAVVTVNGGGGNVSLASQTGSVSELNIGAGGGAGTLNAANIVFGNGSGLINFDHSNADYIFAAGLTGNGLINHMAGGTILTGNGSGFNGPVNIYGGSLSVNNTLGGFVNIMANGTLGGTGTVAHAIVDTGGVLAPGNSIGTLHVAGDVDFATGSFFDVEVDDAGNRDLLDVAGTATISGGTVRVTPAAGGYAASTFYTILSATTLTGTFDAVTSSFVFLTPSLSYDAQNVLLTLDLTAAFQDAASTPNQFAAAGAAEDLGAGNAIYDEILVMTEAEAQAAFDALSGELHASGRTAFFHAAQQIREALLARLRVLSGGTETQTAAADYVPAAGDAVASGHSVWGQIFGSTGETDGDGNAASLDRDAYGFLGGVDRTLGDASRIGFALGYSRSDFDADARASSGESDNFHVAAYAGTKLGAIDLRGTLSYSFQQVATERTVIVGGLTNNLSADYDAHIMQAAIEAGTDIAIGSVMLTPFAGLAAIATKTDGFTETGGPAALAVASEDGTIGVSTLGLRARRETETLTLSGSLAWRHTFGDVDPSSRMAFASAPATSFTIRGVPVSENALALEAGVGLALAERTSLALSYAGEYGSDATDHGLQLELTFRF